MYQNILDIANPKEFIFWSIAFAFCNLPLHLLSIAKMNWSSAKSNYLLIADRSLSKNEYSAYHILELNKTLFATNLAAE